MFERRAKEVKASEIKYWKQVTPDMMSDEEKQGDIFIRHQPSYRSDKLSIFLSKLDNRFEKKSSHQPRVKRQMGSPAQKDIPMFAKNWMIAPHLRNTTDTENNDSDNIDIDSENVESDENDPDRSPTY